MAYSEDTVVAEIIKEDPGVVERLVAVNPSFNKLKNPIFRKTIARFVTLGDVAKVTGMPLEKVLATANNVPFTRDATTQAPALPPEQPSWIDTIDVTRAAHLDVRPLLKRGEEPLGDIMRLAGPMKVGQAFILEAPFDPAPVRRILAGKGFISHPVCLSADHWQITFLRNGDATPPAVRDESDAPADSVRTWQEDGVMHIDVRGLEPPQPMLAVLELIESADAGDTIIVHHEREPLFLYPELEERNWSHQVIDGESGEVRLQLTKAST